MTEIRQYLWSSGPALQIKCGSFEGLAVMEPYSEEPIILTSRKCHGVVLVCMIGRCLISLPMFHCIIHKIMVLVK